MNKQATTAPESWEEYGEYYGYPKCCIKAFVRQPIAFLRPEEIRKASIDGFVPCLRHAKQINSGKITASQLIVDRKCTVPFPKA